MRAVISGMTASLLAIAQLGPAAAQAPAPDLASARALYDAANRAMTDARYDDAVRDYQAAYELTKDPVLFFKIGSAHHAAGQCVAALIYYKNYLREANPDLAFAELTLGRITACGGSPDDAADTEAVEAAPAPSAATELAPAAATTPAGMAPAAELAPLSSRTKDGAWLFVGGALAFVTAGAVLAYSASSAEQDVKDLYLGLNGTPPVFDDATRRRYDDLNTEGRRYQYLSWASFGVAAGCAAGAVILFVRSRSSDEALSMTPSVTPSEASVTATLRF